MILLTCDHPKRELGTLTQIKEKLERKKIICKIINKALIIKAYNLYRPKIITIPHTLRYLINPINVLQNKVKIIVIPTESCIMVDKFIEMQYCNIFSNFKKPSNHNKVDYFFTQSDYTSKYLKKKKLIKKNLISSGFIYFDYWYDQKFKKKNSTKNIGIALTNELPLRFYDSKNFVKNFRNSYKDTDYIENSWRLKQFNLDLYYLSLIFKIVEKIPKNYVINIRLHPLDAQTNMTEVFKNNPNVIVDNNTKIQEWIQNQDVIVSTFSSIYIDSYIFRKPHISLINLIPKSFLEFKAYNSHSYRDYYEYYSNKPTNFKSFIKILRNSKFKKNINFEKKLFKYYSYPNKQKAVERVSENLSKIYDKTNVKFQYKFINNLQKFLTMILGNKITSLLIFYLSEIKLYFLPHTNKSYYSNFTYYGMKIPYIIYKLIKK